MEKMMMCSRFLLQLFVWSYNYHIYSYKFYEILLFVWQTVILNFDLFCSFQCVFEELLVASHYIRKIFANFLQLYNMKISVDLNHVLEIDLKGDSIGELFSSDWHMKHASQLICATFLIGGASSDAISNFHLLGLDIAAFNW